MFFFRVVVVVPAQVVRPVPHGMHPPAYFRQAPKLLPSQKKETQCNHRMMMKGGASTCIMIIVISPLFGLCIQSCEKEKSNNSRITPLPEYTQKHSFSGRGFIRELLFTQDSHMSSIGPVLREMKKITHITNNPSPRKHPKTPRFWEMGHS